LNSADWQLLTIVQNRHVPTAWHDSNLADQIEICEGTASQPYEFGGVEPQLQIWTLAFDQRYCLFARCCFSDDRDIVKGPQKSREKRTSRPFVVGDDHA
jgi:hypothetical protein